MLISNCQLLEILPYCQCSITICSNANATNYTVPLVSLGVSGICGQCCKSISRIALCPNWIFFLSFSPLLGQ